MADYTEWGGGSEELAEEDDDDSRYDIIVKGKTKRK